MELASTADVSTLLKMRDEAAQWMADRGIRQWVVGEFTAETVAESVHSGEYWVVRDQDRITGALRLLWDDPHIWGQQPPDAGYVHSLVITRDAGGRGLGRAMLDWAAARTAGTGRLFLRLDCVASNAALRGYYARNEFSLVDIGQMHYGPVARWERRLVSPCR